MTMICNCKVERLVMGRAQRREYERRTGERGARVIEAHADDCPLAFLGDRSMSWRAANRSRRLAG